MQIFELHFNPKAKEDRFFDSFVYEPENIYEKKLGSLYMAGDLQNALPQDSRFLDDLARVIKGKYYTPSFKNPEKALSESLIKANSFLAEELKKENINWLGNLSFALVSLKDFNLSFAKTGDLKIILLRAGQINDIAQTLELQEINPYPLKIFFNIISGKLAASDKLLILSKEVYEFFKQQNLLTNLAGADIFDGKKIKEILPPELFAKGGGAKTSGICLIICFDKNNENGKNAQEFLFQQEKVFSAADIFSPLIKILKSPFAFLKINLFFLKKINNFFHSFKRGKKNIKNILRTFSSKKIITKLTDFSHKMVKAKTEQRQKKAFFERYFKKESLLIILLVVVLLSGFFIFNNAEEKKEFKIKDVLAEVQGKFFEAENLIKAKDFEKADSLLKEALREIQPLTANNISVREKADSLKKSIEEKLLPLNKVENLENPKTMLALGYDAINFTPQKIVSLRENLYISNPLSPNFYEFNLKENKGQLQKAEKEIEFSTAFANNFLFFAKPNIASVFKNGEWQEIMLRPLPSEFKPSQLFSFNYNLYFLDSEKCEIIKYPYLGNLNWGSAKFWMEKKKENQTCRKGETVTIDGFIWILNNDNSIDQYYMGNYQKTFILNIFPFLTNVAKIKANENSPYIYLLEPKEKRIIIINKTGKVIKQFRSEKFDNLKDFSISGNGKTIWVLNGWEIYQINF